jgi:hypothetical protein
LPAGSSRYSLTRLPPFAEARGCRPPWPSPLLQSTPHWLEPLASAAEAVVWAPPLLALPAFAPLLINRSHVYSRRLRRTAFGSSVPTDNSRSTLVVSHHLGGLLRATAAGLLHPAASHGVRRVSRCQRPSHPRVLRPVSPFPATRFIPFKGFPSSAAVPHHCGRFPLAVGRQPPRP